jgi:hypothetical protein
MSVMLGKCRHAFMNQARSWKPQEDAGGYVSIVPRHTIDYTLAENDYTYFDNGQVLRHAEYEVGFCDNTGDAAGFGDTGYARAPYAQNLHWTLWYYRDGRFKWWLERIGQTGSIAPYDPAIEPVRWDDLAGSTVFELHPEVYEYTSNYADYGGEVTPPNIPLEKCFDKIAFRESLEMDAEYFLLDGYSRGKHLQYDGNCHHQVLRGRARLAGRRRLPRAQHHRSQRRERDPRRARGGAHPRLHRARGVRRPADGDADRDGRLRLQRLRLDPQHHLAQGRVCAGDRPPPGERGGGLHLRGQLEDAWRRASSRTRGRPHLQ